MTPCRICGSKDPTKLFTKDNLNILSCGACGLRYTDSYPDENSLRDLYCEGYFKSEGAGTSYFNYLAEEAAMEVNSKRRLAAIMKVRPDRLGTRLLDVGCATGVFLKSASSSWQVQGVELSPFASSYAREKNGLSVKTGSVRQAAYPDNFFDIVTMWDVVEHLSAPVDDLTEVHRILKDDGLLILTTGDVSSLFARICGRYWHLYNPSQHLSYFSRKTVKTLLNKAGFNIVKIRMDGNYFTLAYLFSSLAMYYPSSLTKTLCKIINKSPLSNLRVCVNLGDIMTVYSSKMTNP